MCELCKRGVSLKDHPAPSPPKKGEFFRKHNHLALEVGARDVARAEAHYAKHGILVNHRPKKDGLGYEPVVTQPRDYQRLLKSRGLVDYS